MKLVERYATECGLKIGKQHLLENFFPLPFDRYITIHASSGMLGKNYPYYSMVLDFIRPYLDKNNIKVVQMGSKDDAELPACFYTKGRTNMHQGSFILSKSLLHLGNDSVWCHRAGYLGIPLVELFGPTSIPNHSPYNYNKDKTILIESHRWGRNPTFASQENPSSMALIRPEVVAESVLKLLGIEHTPFYNTKLIGPLYLHTIFDWVPNAPFTLNLNPEIPVSVRMDIEFNEQNLLNLLQTGRKVTIVTKQPINIQLLVNFKQNILSYNHEIDENCPINYPRVAKSIISNSVFFTRTKDIDVLSSLRFKFFDICVIEQIIFSTKEDFIKESNIYLNNPVDKPSQIDIMKFKTNKFILSNGKIYLSYAHLKLDKSITDLTNNSDQVIDDESFFIDLPHYLIYAEANTAAS